MNRAVVAIGMMVVLFLGFPALSTAFNDSVAESQPGDNITVQRTVSPGDTVSLSVTDGRAVGETVNVSANGTVFQAGDDYRFSPRTRNVTITQNSDISSGQTVNVTFSEHEPSQSQTLVLRLSQAVGSTGELWALMGAVGLVIGFVLALAAAGRGA